jgi:hypothetical protein
MDHENLASTDRPAYGEFELPSEPESEAVAEVAPGPSDPPRVVIEYRTKGLPWPLVLPLLGLVSLTVVAAYHRLAIWSFTHPTVGSEAAPRTTSAAHTDPPLTLRPLPPWIPSEPLSLSSQRVVEPNGPPRMVEPVELAGPPAVARSEPQSALMSLPFPDQLLERIPKPQLADIPPATLQAALIFATPAPAPIPPKPADDAVPVPAPPNDEPASDPTRPKTAEAAPGPSPLDLVAPPLPEPLPSREQVLADIQQEAQAKQAERAELEQFKDQIPDIARQAAAMEVQAQRAKFLADLRSLIREKKGKAGVEIGQLHLRYNENVDPKLELQLRQLIKRFSGRTSLRTKIKALRALGLPEPRILEIAVTYVHRREHSSRCNRFEPEMYVLAARELIATALPAQAKPRTDRETAQNQ